MFILISDILHCYIFSFLEADTIGENIRFDCECSYWIECDGDKMMGHISATYLC